MHKIAVMGDRDSILGFKAIGFDVYPTEGQEEAGELLARLAQDGYALIYITEDLAIKISDEISRYRNSYFPAIILIPGTKGPLGIGMKAVKESVEKAVGADILSQENQ
ncbi:MAG: V-type ATP synthase subunit F [Clostridiaceae bacterium]|nr:V-type ATP synthase subunit F [Clostridiaceae bacterium]